MPPMTPPHPHAPLSIANPSKPVTMKGSSPVHTPHHLIQHAAPTPIGINGSHYGGGAGTRAAQATAAKAAANGDHPDFAPVFFSPLPRSYLAIGRSESQESFLGSMGSPDVTMRGGRLSTAALNSDWSEDSPSNTLSMLAVASTSHASHDTSDADTTTHGRRSRLSSTQLAESENGTEQQQQAPLVASTNGWGPHSSGSSSASDAASHLQARAGLAPAARLSDSAAAAPTVQTLPDGPAMLPLMHMDMLQNGSMSIAAVASAAAESLHRKSAPWGPLRLVAGVAMIPHIDKAEKGGEDAYCICLRGLGAVGVADGVSGWAEEGVDPAEYSRTLMRFAAEALESAAQPSGPESREVIRYAHQATIMAGSSTVCLAVMKQGNKLEVANLGDSGVRIIRDGKIVFASAAQQHMFNMPFQLSHPSIIESPDDADSADVTLVDVQPGDVLVMATDGLYDNVFDEEIAALCAEPSQRRRGASASGPPATPAEAEDLALLIARLAHKYAQDPYKKTPWSVSACEQGFAWARYFAKGGGKMDDVTVVVAFITE